MKILQVNVTFTPIGGGVPAILYQLSKALMQKGHEVVIYASDFKLDQEFINSLRGVRVYPFHCWLRVARVYLVSGMIGEAKRKLKDFDIIHLHCFRSFQSIIVHHYAKKYGIPYVLQARGSLITFFQKKWQKRIFDVIWGHRILKDASKLVALTPMEAAQYRNMGISEDKIEIIPNGIELSEFDNLPERGEFRRKYYLNDVQKVILYLGRIHKTKGLNLLVIAFAELSKLLNNVKLVIVGPDDGYLPSLKKLIAELEISNEVLLTGHLYGEDKVEAYVDADVFVLPSVYEIFGNVVLEACACGTPVVVTDRCGIADAVDGQAGLVVPYDKDQLRDGLLHILSDDKMRLRFGEKGKLLVRERFSWEKIAERIEDIYKRCINQ